MPRPREIDDEIILKEAERLIGEDGYENFSMRKLASACGIALGSIYTHFERKVDILFTLAKEFWEECYDGIQDEGEDFFSYVKKIYVHLSSYLTTFRKGLLNSLINLKSPEKEDGINMMSRYLKVIKDKLDEKLARLNPEPRIVAENKGEFLSFVQRNIVAMLLNGDDYEFFDKLLRVLLQN